MNTRQSLSCNRSADLIGAASVGIGGYQESQRRVLENLERSVPGGFASFLKGYLEQVPNSSTNTPTELLPMPRPFRPPAGRPPRSSRRRARWAATRAAMHLANKTAAALSWLACGSPTEAQSKALLHRIAALRASDAQRQAANRFLTRARPFARRGALHLRGGRAALASQLPFALGDATYDRLRPRSAALPAMPAQACTRRVAARVSLPTIGATVPVAPWLPPEWRERL